MPRGKAVATSERIARIDAQIAKLETQLASLKKERKELVAQERQEKLDKLLDAVDEKGMDIDRAIELIRNAPTEDEAQ